MLTTFQSLTKIAGMLLQTLDDGQTRCADVISESQPLTGQYFVTLTRFIIDDENPLLSLENQFQAMGSSTDYDHAMVYVEKVGDCEWLVVDIGIAVNDIGTAARQNCIDVFVIH